MYQAQRPFRSEFVPIRDMSYHVLVWGEAAPGKVPLVLLHGWMDVAASFQFVVDALRRDHFIIAPDWRGFGKTGYREGVGYPGADHYWYADYLADLDFLLDHYAPGEAVNLVGHSMGGNIAMLYGGVRPQRVRRLVNLEGFGMPATVPAQAPTRLANWMDQLKLLRAGEINLKPYDSLDGVARRLIKTNPRLSPDKASWLAQHWATEGADGSWRVLGAPAHKITSAQLYRVEEVLATHKRLSMPVLAVEATESNMDVWWKGTFTPEEYRERLKVVPQVEIAQIDNAGHMLHHDQPEELAALMEPFIH
ncbi:alpha/beta hydrolase [Rhodoferax sp. OV413]|uniref:alpha/beta fold hydrolase n=1 Tax=Rhodoferax sp. OV413 TaxID=1855285 RepID=UPI0025FCA3A1|nr:alpha/beta hydrolase [Rhodoferax sp. OV413]